MRTPRDKSVIEYWLTLHNRLRGTSFRVTDWPDTDSSKQNVDALCTDDASRVLALEHTLIEPFENEKADAARFLQTLAALENDPALLQSGFTYLVSQKVDAIPKGTKWSTIPGRLRSELAKIIRTLPEGRTLVPLSLGDCEIELSIRKMKTHPDDRGKFLTARRDPGEPRPQLMLNALQRKVPKLAAAKANLRILLLEKDSVAGTIENQFDQVQNDTAVKNLVRRIDQIWAVDTAALQSENVIFTNPIVPREDDNGSFCSLNVVTEEFWKVSR